MIHLQNHLLPKHRLLSLDQADLVTFGMHAPVPGDEEKNMLT